MTDLERLLAKYMGLTENHEFSFSGEWPLIRGAIQCKADSLSNAVLTSGNDDVVLAQRALSPTCEESFELYRERLGLVVPDITLSEEIAIREPYNLEATIMSSGMKFPAKLDFATIISKDEYRLSAYGQNYAVIPIIILVNDLLEYANVNQSKGLICTHTNTASAYLPDKFTL